MGYFDTRMFVPLSSTRCMLPFWHHYLQWDRWLGLIKQFPVLTGNIALSCDECLCVHLLGPGSIWSRGPPTQAFSPRRQTYELCTGTAHHLVSPLCVYRSSFMSRIRSLTKLVSVLNHMLQTPTCGRKTKPCAEWLRQPRGRHSCTFEQVWITSQVSSAHLVTATSV